MSDIILGVFCLSLIFITFKLARTKSLLSSSVFLTIFSLLVSCIYLLMDAPDVAMTEVAVSACLSTSVILSFLKTIQYSDHNCKVINSGRSWKNIAIGIFCLGFILVMILLKLELPTYGAANSPVQTNLSHYYVANTEHQIAIPSMVTAILASYRGFDTLGETTVILIGAIGCALLLNKPGEASEQVSADNLQGQPILRNITNFIFYFIILYSLYIQLNGETSPGGGFQAGAIFASGIIAYNLIYGHLQKSFSSKSFLSVGFFGVLLYASVGLISYLSNDNYLNYYSLGSDSIKAQHLGIFLVEIGVGFTVASAMCLIYSLFKKQ